MPLTCNAVPALQAGRSAEAGEARRIRRRRDGLEPGPNPVNLFLDRLKPGGHDSQRLAGSVVRGLQRRGWAPASPHSAATQRRAGWCAPARSPPEAALPPVPNLAPALLDCHRQG